MPKKVLIGRVILPGSPASPVFLNFDEEPADFGNLKDAEQRTGPGNLTWN